MIAVKNICNYSSTKKIRGPNATKIPKPKKVPNPVLVDMFNYDDPKLIDYFVGLI
jgi:hypothetical protein